MGALERTPSMKCSSPRAFWVAMGDGSSVNLAGARRDLAPNGLDATGRAAPTAASASFSRASMAVARPLDASRREFRSS